LPRDLDHGYRQALIKVDWSELRPESITVLTMDDEDFDMFDEFGNYIGPDHNGREQREQEIDDEFEENEAEIIREEAERIDEEQIILYEDKKYYPEMDEVYRGVETLIEEEDTQAITDPLIKDYKEKKFDLKVPSPQLNYSSQFLADMMKNPHTIRNVALVGHLHHGKTMMMDTLISQTHEDLMPPRFTDARFDESERKISIKACPMSLVLPDSKGKNFLVNIIDTPGHPNFIDEACCGLRLADGAVLVVDCVEGCMANTEYLIDYIVHEQLPVCLLLTT
jgi:116 kDa U5 small nuclear ribonucleoprotein component